MGPRSFRANRRPVKDRLTIFGKRSGFVGKRGGSDAIDKTGPARAILPFAYMACTNLFDRSLRAKILRAYPEDDTAHVLEGVTQHELFDFQVVGPAPVRSRQERPADLDLACVFLVSVKSRRADDAAVAGIKDDQRPAALQRLAKERLEYIFPVTIVIRMLFPDEWIRSNGVQALIVVGPERPELDQITPQIRLELKRHLW